MTVKKWQECLGDHGQILKARGDSAPVFLECSQAKPGAVANFLGCSQADSNTATLKLHPMHSTPKPSWVQDGKLGIDELRARVEPWLTTLIQSEHLSLLVGSGLTTAVHQIGAGDSWPEVKEVASGMSKVTFQKSNLKEVMSEAVKRTAQAAGRGDGNFEDQIRVANELLRGLEILSVLNADLPEHKQANDLRCDLKDALQSLADSILKCEWSIANAEKRKEAFNCLVSFLMSFSNRTGTRERLHLFTTNYDRIVEAGADAAGLRLIDRFVGTLSPVFRASRLDVDMHYNPPGIRGEPRYLEGVARFTKLHGSIDWLNCDGDIRRIGLPFGTQDTSPYLVVPGPSEVDAMNLMIYPNATKERETSAYPYVELFRDFAASICRPNSTLICYGYGFGDEHINRVIKDALTIPSTHLVIISYNDPLSRIMDTYYGLGRHAQVTLLLGDHLGNLEVLSKNYLPIPAIDRTMSAEALGRLGIGNDDNRNPEDKTK